MADEKTFTQEELDAIVSKRVKEEKDLREENEKLKAEVEARKAEITALQKTHSLQREIDKRGLDHPLMQAKLETIKRLVDLESEEDPAQQLESLSKSVPELFDVPQGAGSGYFSKTPVLDREKPLTEEAIQEMSLEQMTQPGIMERIDKFLAGERG
jgi:predicted RNase H-like nuclease (RuvC/YqgF family)